MKLIERILLEIIRPPLLAIWHLMGWRLEKMPPEIDKFVLIAAPHTTYWDFYHILMMALTARRRPYTTTKHSLFWFPLGVILRLLGAIPINREQALNAVDFMADIFKQHERAIVVITAEGTRKKTKFWKSGFYYTALKAGVPIACGYIDYKRRRGGVGLVLMPTGNLQADFELIKAFYMQYGRSGKHPELVSDLAIKERRYDPSHADDAVSDES